MLLLIEKELLLLAAVATISLQQENKKLCKESYVFSTAKCMHRHYENFSTELTVEDKLRHQDFQRIDPEMFQELLK